MKNGHIQPPPHKIIQYQITQGLGMYLRGGGGGGGACDVDNVGRWWW